MSGCLLFLAFAVYCHELMHGVRAIHTSINQSRIQNLEIALYIHMLEREEGRLQRLEYRR